MTTLKDLFAGLEPEAIKCGCGKELVLSPVKGEPGKYEFRGCSCGHDTLNLPKDREYAIVGPEGAPLFIYRRKA
jgi:hypothetical protein